MKIDLKDKQDRQELVNYVLFGIITSVIATIIYFGILLIGEYVLQIAPDDKRFYWVRLVAQILQWVISVLVAFLTNKKFVFKKSDPNASTWQQLHIFYGSRLLTLGLDSLVTFATVWLLHAAGYSDVPLHFIIDCTISADIIAKVVSSVIVVIANYFLSKIFVFRSAVTTEEVEKIEKTENTENTAEE
ncbi:MAG: GtrA family protein [Clostridia bacterium]|nr:GtrA family protein [Clostridia bacterium]